MAITTYVPRRHAMVRIGETQMDVEPLTYAGHAAEPVKSIDDIDYISNYLISTYRYRDNLMFIMGINFGLRYSDLCMLRYGDIIREDGQYFDPIRIRERKTAKRRINSGTDEEPQYKLKLPRVLFVNDAVAEAFE